MLFIPCITWFAGLRFRSLLCLAQKPILLFCVEDEINVPIALSVAMSGAETFCPAQHASYSLYHVVCRFPVPVAGGSGLVLRPDVLHPHVDHQRDANHQRPHAVLDRVPRSVGLEGKSCGALGFFLIESNINKQWEVIALEQ